MLVPPPAVPMLPRASCKIQYARVLLLPLVCCVPPMHQMTVPGRLLANVRATRSSWLPGAPVTRSTSSGVHRATSSLIWSMPQTRVRMNSLSSQLFSKMCHKIPQTSATSEPGRKRTYSSACAAVRVKRGSHTIKGALFCSLAFSMCSRDTGCASAGLPPITKIALELWMSL